MGREHHINKFTIRFTLFLCIAMCCIACGKTEESTDAGTQEVSTDFSEDTEVTETADAMDGLTEMTEEFRQSVVTVLEEKQAELWLYDALSGDLLWLFAEYNGEKLQRIPGTEKDTYSPAVCPDVIYYQAEEGEALETIVAEMLDAMIIPLKEFSESRSFTILEYVLDEQEILTQEMLTDRIAEQIWKAWYEISANDDTVGMSQEEYIRQCIPDAETGITYLAEDMWLLPYINGYYSYEGSDMGTMAEIMEFETDLSHDGMLPFMRQGNGAAFVYLLVKENSVYRLQRVVDIQKLWETH